MKLEPVSYIKYWFMGITQPEKTIKELKKKKYGIKDGLCSSSLIALFVGIVLFLFIYYLLSTTLAINPLFSLIINMNDVLINSFLLLIVALPFLAMAGLLIWSLIFKKIVDIVGGKWKYEYVCGFFGVLAGMTIIVSVPAVFLTFLATSLFQSTNISYLILIGFGALITSALSGIVAALTYQMISEMEKISLPKSGLVYGLTTGISSFVVLILSFYVYRWIIEWLIGISLPTLF